MIGGLIQGRLSVNKAVSAVVWVAILGFSLFAGVSVGPVVADPVEPGRGVEECEDMVGDGRDPLDLLASKGSGSKICFSSTAGSVLEGGVVLDPELLDMEGRTSLFVRFQPVSLEGVEDVVDHLKSESRRAQEPIQAFAQNVEGVRLLNSFWIFNGVLLEVDLDVLHLSHVAAVEGVQWLHPNREVELFRPHKGAEEGPGVVPLVHGTHTYGLEQVRAPEVWSTHGTQGETSVKIAVLDTGVDAAHPDIDLHTTDPDDPKYPGGWAEFDVNGTQTGSEPYDDDGHGTHVSGSVAGGDASGTHIGVAPGVTLIHGAVISDEGGTNAAVWAGMQWGVDEGADVMSMSLGGSGFSQGDIEPVQNAYAAGTFVVAAIGNSGEGTSGSPGNVYDVFSVGASNSTEGIGSFSGGEVVTTSEAYPGVDPGLIAHWPDEYIVPKVVAPGVAVLSSVPGGTWESSGWDGTSMATPHVSGVVGLMVSVAGPLTATEIREALVQTSWKPSGQELDQDVRYGYGIVDALHAVAFVSLETGLQGVVTGGDGEPLERARVMIDKEGWFNVTTKADGTYKLPVEPGTYTVTVTHPFGHAEHEEVVTVDAGVFTDKDFALTSALDARVLQGQVSEVGSGRSVEAVVEVANAQTITLRLTGTYSAPDATLRINGTEAGFGVPVALSAASGEVTVAVNTKALTSGVLSLEHEVADGTGTKTVTTGPTTVLEKATYVAVVDDIEKFAEDIVSSLKTELSTGVIYETIKSSEVGDHDVYVVQNFEDGDAALSFITAVDGEDAGVVYLDQWSHTDHGDEVNGLKHHSQVTGDPQDPEQDSTIFTNVPVGYRTQVPHPILAGHAAGELVSLYSGVDWTWFGATGATVLALVEKDGETAGNGLAVDEDSRTVFASALGHTTWITKDHYTSEANRILTNSVVHLGLDAGFLSDCSGLACTFDASPSHAPGATIDSYSWSFPGGDSDSGQSVEYTFATQGSFSVSLTVENDRGSTATTSGIVEVAPVGLDVEITGTNSPVVAGDVLQVTVNVTNPADQEITDDVRFLVGTDVKDQATRTLAAGAEESLTLEWVTDPAEAGTHTVEVSSVQDQDTVIVTLESPEPLFDVQITGTDSPVLAGGTLNVTAQVENVGNSDGTKKVSLLIGDDLKDEVDLSLARDQQDTVVLQWTTTDGDRGTHTARIASEDGEDTATVVVQLPDAFAVALKSTDSPVVEGEVLLVEVTVTNTGDTEGTQSVRLLQGSDELDSAAVTLAGGASQDVTLQWTTTEGDAGSHSLTVQSDDDAETVFVVVQTPAFFAVELLETNSPVGVTDTLEAMVRVRNTGQAEGTQTLTLEIAGDAKDSKEMTLAGGEQEDVTFEWGTTAGDAGTFQALVGSLQDSDETTVEVHPAPQIDALTVDGSSGGAVYVNADPAVSVQATSSSDIASVQVTLSSTVTSFRVTADAVEQPDGRWNATLPLADVVDDGDYTVTARLVNELDQTAESGAQGLVVDRTAPSLSAALTALVDGDATLEVRSLEDLIFLNATVRHPGAEGATGDVTLQEVEGKDRTWEGTFDVTGAGAYRVTITGQDVAGNERVRTVNLVLDPAFSLVEDENGNGVGLLMDNETGMFILFRTALSLSDVYAAFAQNDEAYEPVPSDLVGVSFLTTHLHPEIMDNLESAIIGFPVDPDIEDPGSVEIHYFTGGEWVPRGTQVVGPEFLGELDPGLTGQFWVNETTSFSTYGALVVDEEPPELSGVAPAHLGSASPGELTIRFEYEDALSGIDVAAIRLVVDEQDVTLHENTSISSVRTTHRLTAQPSAEHNVTLTVLDSAGNEAVFYTNFTVRTSSGGGGGGGGDGSSDGSPAPPVRLSVSGRTPSTQGAVSAFEGSAQVPSGTDRLEVSFPSGSPVQSLSMDVDGSGRIRVSVEVFDSLPPGAPTVLPAGFADSGLFITVVAVAVSGDPAATGGGFDLQVGPSSLGGHDPAQGVVLHGVGDDWQIVPTELLEGEDDPVYRVETPSFSPFAFTVDTSPPELTLVAPDGSDPLEAQPEFRVAWSDNRGIDLGSVKFLLEGEPVDAQVDDEGATFLPDSPLDEGVLLLEVAVRDRSGLQTERSWEFDVAGPLTGTAEGEDEENTPFLAPVWFLVLVGAAVGFVHSRGARRS